MRTSARSRDGAGDGFTNRRMDTHYKVPLPAFLNGKVQPDAGNKGEFCRHDTFKILRERPSAPSPAAASARECQSCTAETITLTTPSPVRRGPAQPASRVVPTGRYCRINSASARLLP